MTSLTIILFETIHLPLNRSFSKRQKHSYAKWRWQQNTQVIAVLHAKTPLSCCVSSQLKTGTVLSTERIYVHYEWKTNRPFSSSKNSHLQSETKCKTFLMKMSYICMRIKNHFHVNSFAPSLALKQRLVATLKWPISLYKFPLRMSWENLIKARSIFSSVIILYNFITFPPDCLLILLSENWCWSLLGLKWLTKATCTPWVPILCFFDPDVVLILHPFSYEVNTCVDPPHEQKIVALQFQPQKRKDPDMTLLAVTAGADGKFKIWVLGEERLGRSKRNQKNCNDEIRETGLNYCFVFSLDVSQGSVIEIWGNYGRQEEPTILISRLLLRMRYVCVASICFDFHKEWMQCTQRNLITRVWIFYYT